MRKFSWIVPLVVLTSLALGLARPGLATDPSSPAGSLVVPRPRVAIPLQVSIVKTSEARSSEAFVFSGGNPFKAVTLNYGAVLVRHPRGEFLFDTGLGRQIDEQYGREMPWWAKPLLTYDRVEPARDQLDRVGTPTIRRIIPSHAHWDHVSGLVDFPEAEVWVTPLEHSFLQHAGPPVLLRSQVDSPSIHWKTFDFTRHPYGGYELSYDLFSDGSAILVPMPGHTPGSVGLFLNLASGRQFFFVGDAVWSLEAARRLRAKTWPASQIVDADGPEAWQSVATLNAVMRANPGLIVVPAHDALAQTPWGYFPRWID